MSSALLVLSLIVFLPALGALVIALFPKGKDDAVRWFGLATTVAVLLLTLWVALPGGEDDVRFQLGAAQMQSVFNVAWIPTFGIEYYMGTDGISFPLVMLTAGLSVLAMGASWSITKHVKGYMILFLLLETGMLGVFLALDFFLFFVFWEVMLLPMYFLIGAWGGPRREYAAVKFFLYTMAGSVCMLVGILLLYFNSDLRALSAEQLQKAHVPAAVQAELGWEFADSPEFQQWRVDVPPESPPRHTFNILALQQLGQHTDQFSQPWLLGKSVQWWAFLLLLIGFAIKVPTLPFHTWLPDAHVEAPTPISMILAGVLLKMGGYGILRICYPICPEAAYELAWLVAGIGVVSMVYGAFAALHQKDFKRLVAYSSVSHMGYVMLGLGVWSASAANGFDAAYWKLGVNGAMFQMIAHGIASAGMFFMVGVLYDRVHHRNLNEFGGLFAKMPVYCALAWIIFLAAVGLPGLCGFIGEAFVVLSAWSYSKTLAIAAAATVILTAAYVLWAFQRVYLGPEYRGPHEEALTPSTWRERAIAVPLVVAALALGIAPNHTLLPYMQASVDQTVDDMVAWQQRHEARLAARRPEQPLGQQLAQGQQPQEQRKEQPQPQPQEQPQQAQAIDPPTQATEALAPFIPPPAFR